MNLSRIIKSDSFTANNSEILTSRPISEEMHVEKFCSFDSLWQSSDTEYVDAMAKLEEERARVKIEAEELLSAARNKVDQIKKEAHDQGFQAGKAEALAEEKVKLEEKLRLFDEFLIALEGDRRELNKNYEKDILVLVKTMVDKVLNHEVSVNPMVIEVCLKTAMSYVVESSKIKIRLNSRDFDRIKEASIERPELLSGSKKIELTEDPTISEGGCFLETGFGDVDATLESRKDKLYEAIDAIFQKALAE